MKRFYKEIAVDRLGDGWQILLDQKPVRTPLRHILCPQRDTLAQAIAAEWAGQTLDILPDTMPLTQLQTTLQDRYETENTAWRHDIVSYLETDLLCYVTEDVPDIALAQAQSWTPLRNWFSDWLGCPPLFVTTGLAVSDVPAVTADALVARMAESTAEVILVWRYVAGLTGSCILGAALAHHAQTPDSVFRAAQLEELHHSAKANEDVHGPDPHQAKLQAKLRDELESCASFCQI